MLSFSIRTCTITFISLTLLACSTANSLVLAAPSESSRKSGFSASFVPRQDSPSASPPFFDDLVYESLAYNFTLTAVNKTLSNANTTGVPLVLGQNGAIVGATLYVTSTYNSYPFNDYPLLALASSSLRAYTETGAWITNATSILNPAVNTPLRWLTTSLGSNGFGTNYTAILSAGDEFAKLAALGRRDLWSLCPFGHQERSQVNLVFNVSSQGTASGSVPVPAECWGVEVNIVMA